LAAALLSLIVLAACARSSQPAAPTITQDELVRRAQEIMDSVAVGDPTPWKKYFAEDCLFFDEKGRSMNKEALLKDVAPLPTGYTGTVKIIGAQSRIFADAAVLSYDLDETEVVFGQQLKARYHTTDTWLRRNGNWQIIAEQVLRYYEDPASAKANPAKYRDYVGSYQLAPGVLRTVSAEGGDLYVERSGGPKTLLLAEAPDLFFRKGVEGRILFHRSENGRVDTLIDRRNNEDILWKRVGP
jgi:hypothetical protein